MISTKIFDMAVNMGQRQAYKLVQRAINSLQSSQELVVDGLVGPSTIGAINSLEKEDFELIVHVRTEQAKFYLDLIENKPDLGSFTLGWLRRAAS